MTTDSQKNLSFLQNSIPELFENYTVVSCLKQGKESSAYLVSRDGDEYVLKYGAGVYADAVENEYLFLKTSEHSFLPRAVDFIRIGEESWLLREYVEGRTLAEAVAADGILAEAEAVKIMLQLCDIIGILHREKIIHRDVTPGNIIIGSEGSLSLIDMGTARIFKPSATNDTVYMGTAATAAPELFGGAQTDMRTDIYALGMIFLFMLRANFDRKGIVFTSPNMRRIITKCTEYDPNRRYQTTAELLKALKRTTQRMHLRMVRAALFCTMLFAGGVAAGVLIGPRQQLSPLPVVFREARIEAAVRVALGFDEKQIITENDLLKVEYLAVMGTEIVNMNGRSIRELEQLYYFSHPNNSHQRGDIYSLEDLAGLKNLKYLAVAGQHISDLTPLAGLPLIEINLDGNPLVDISPLRFCAFLTIAHFDNTYVSDVTPLRYLSNLDTIHIQYTSVDSIKQLEGMPIGSLHIFGAPAKDYENLAAIPNLSYVYVSHLTPEELDTICAVEQLKNLTVHDTDLVDFEPFTRIKNLENGTLSVSFCNISTLNGVEKLPPLFLLCISDTNIYDLSLLRNTRITQLALAPGNDTLPVTDFSPIFDIIGLERVDVSRQQADEILAIDPNPPFELFIYE